MTYQIPNELREAFDQAKSIAVLTGTSLSEACGNPDLLSLLKLLSSEEVPKAFTKQGFAKCPEMFYHAAAPIYQSLFKTPPSNQSQLDEEWFEPVFRSMFYARPTLAHYALANWEKRKKEIYIVTSDMCEMHEKAGSTCVIEPYGSVFKLECLYCHTIHSINKFKNLLCAGVAPRCPECHTILAPAIPLFKGNFDDISIQDIYRSPIFLSSPFDQALEYARPWFGSPPDMNGWMHGAKKCLPDYIRKQMADLVFIVGMSHRGNTPNDNDEILFNLFIHNELSDNNVVIIEKEPSNPFQHQRGDHPIWNNPYLLAGDIGEILNSF